MSDNNYYMPLFLGLTTEEMGCYYDPKLPLPAHELVIRPLLYNSINSYVYGLDKDSDLYKNNSDILIAEKGKFKFDITKECIKGHEYLWNATRWGRGSIVMVCKSTDVDFKSIFKGCYRVGISGTPNSGNSSSATKNSRKEMENGNIAACLSASNGMAWINLYVNEPLRTKLFYEAKEYIQK